MAEIMFWLVFVVLAIRIGMALWARFGREASSAPPAPRKTWLSDEPPRPELATDVELLRFTMDLVLDEYATLAQPVQHRLKSWKPHLTPAQVDAYTSVCQEVREYGIGLVQELADGGQPDDEDAWKGWRETMLGRYPWLSEGSLRSMWGTGWHAALK